MTTKNLTLLQMNDLHAYLEPHAELFWGAHGPVFRKAGGLARIATLIRAARREFPDRVLAFDGGDTFHGTHVAVTTKGKALAPILSAVGLDGMTAHWDFAYGPEQLKTLVATLPYPMLAANCFDEVTGQLIYPPSQLFERGGLRVGVIGLAAVIVKNMPEQFNRGLRFTLGNEVLPGHIERLRRDERADLIVVVSHLGFPQDVRLAQEVAGIDVLLSAHTHNRLSVPVRVGDTLIIQSGSHGSFLGRLDLQVEGGRVVDFDHHLIHVSESIEPEPQVQTLVDQALAPSRDELAQVVGHTATALYRNTVLEATMDNLLLQSLMAITGASLAFSNGWRYGAPIPPGPVTLNDLWNIIPVNPPVSTVDLLGEEIWTMLEENLEHTFARDPYQQMGGYVKRALGLRAYVKLENPAGQRLQELYIGDEPVSRERSYMAAFVTTQGVPAKYGLNRRHLEEEAITVLRRYLEPSRDGCNPIESEIRHTFVAV